LESDKTLTNGLAVGWWKSLCPMPELACPSHITDSAGFDQWFPPAAA